MMITFRNLILSGILASSIGITAVPCAAQAPSALQTATPAASGVTTPVTVMVPEPDTELVVDGKPVDGTGSTRIVEAPAAARGTAHEHLFTISGAPMPTP